MPPRLTIRGAWRSLPLTLRSRPLAQAQQQLQQLQQPSIAVAVFARQFTDDAATPQYRGPTPAAAAGESTLPTLPASMMRPGESPPPPLPSPRELREIREEEVRMQELTANEQAVHQLQQAAYSQYSGLTFEEPPMPQDKLKMAKYHMRYRYDEGISQLTKLLMRDGKLSKAQNDMAKVLNYLRTSPPPKVNPQRPLLPGSPPPEQLPLNPNLYLMLAVDSVAPLVRIRGYSGLAGGGKALEVPVPVGKRARRREAFSWIMDTVNKRPSMGSGKKMLAHRIGDEIIAVVEGKSSVWSKRDIRHKLATSVRANLNSPALLKRKT